MATLAIHPEDELLRRLAPDAVDRATNVPRLNAFYVSGKPDAEISVHVRRVAGNYQDLRDRANRSHFGMGVLIVADVVELGFRVEPDASEDDPAHAVILGASTRAHCEMLAQITRVVKLPQSKPPTSTEAAPS